MQYYNCTVLQYYKKLTAKMIDKSYTQPESHLDEGQYWGEKRKSKYAVDMHWN